MTTVSTLAHEWHTAGDPDSTMTLTEAIELVTAYGLDWKRCSHVERFGDSQIIVTMLLDEPEASQ
ncbi:MAG: hypothetical protein ACTHQM_19235 [Thermoanaerobaculia bacterium]